MKIKLIYFNFFFQFLKPHNDIAETKGNIKEERSITHKFRELAAIDYENTESSNFSEFD